METSDIPFNMSMEDLENKVFCEIKETVGDMIRELFTLGCCTACRAVVCGLEISAYRIGNGEIRLDLKKERIIHEL